MLGVGLGGAHGETVVWGLGVPHPGCQQLFTDPVWASCGARAWAGLGPRGWGGGSGDAWWGVWEAWVPSPSSPRPVGEEARGCSVSPPGQCCKPHYLNPVGVAGATRRSQVSSGDSDPTEEGVELSPRGSLTPDHDVETAGGSDSGSDTGTRSGSSCLQTVLYESSHRSRTLGARTESVNCCCCDNDHAFSVLSDTNLVAVLPAEIKGSESVGSLWRLRGACVGSRAFSCSWGHHVPWLVASFPVFRASSVRALWFAPSQVSISNLIGPQVAEFGTSPSLQGPFLCSLWTPRRQVWSHRDLLPEGVRNL